MSGLAIATSAALHLWKLVAVASRENLPHKLAITTASDTRAGETTMSAPFLTIHNVEDRKNILASDVFLLRIASPTYYAIAVG